MKPAKSPGQLAYEADCKICPNYDGGIPRKSWDQLAEWAHHSWETNPTPRAHPQGGEGMTITLCFIAAAAILTLTIAALIPVFAAILFVRSLAHRGDRL